MEDLLHIALLDEMKSEDIDEMLIYDILRPRQSSFLRSTKYPKINLQMLSDQEVVNLFRFEREHIKMLVPALGLPTNISYKSGCQTTGLEGLLILLRRLTYPNRWSDLEPLFGLSSPYMSKVFNEIMEMILEKNEHLLQLRNNPWMNEAKYDLYSSVISEKGSPVENCFGFIDGTARAICRPDVNQEDFYSGHKRMHCIKYLGVLYPDGMIGALVGPYPGRRHDSGIFKDSNFYDELVSCSTFGRKKICLYGDAGFSIREHLLCPYPGNALSPQKAEFNKNMSSVRQCVEWGFGKIITEFAFLDLKKNQKLLLQEVGMMFKVATILTNCHSCLYSNQTASYFGLDPPTISEFLI